MTKYEAKIDPLLADTVTTRAMLGNIGKTKLYDLLREGKLERVKLGGKTLVTMASIRAAAVHKRVGTEEEAGIDTGDE